MARRGDGPPQQRRAKMSEGGTMKRRKFITTAAIGGVSAAALASSFPQPAIAQSQPEIKWRLASSFPKSLDTLYRRRRADRQARRRARPTASSRSGAFAAGEIVPALQVLDAVQNGTVELGHTASYYYVGKDPTFALRLRHAVRPEHAPAERLDDATAAACELMRDVLQGLQRLQHPGRQHRLRRWAAGSARRSRPSPTSRA